MSQMDDYRKWHLAWAKLDAFSKDLPTAITENHVAEFHTILDLLHEASREDVSPFRIHDDAMKPRVISVEMGNDFTGRPGRTNYSRERFCDQNLLIRRINEVRNYFERISPPAERPKMGF